jgi:hypothetical protein
LADGRVLIALAQGPLVAAPTWTRYDTISDQCRCSGFDIERGRQSAFDVTETGTATVYWHDQDGTLNDVDLVGLQIQLQILNPVTSTWVPQFRGLIDDITYDLDPSGVVSNVQMECVDMFDYLGGVEMVVGAFGDALPAGMSGVVFYEDGSVQTRITTLLDDAGVPSALYAVFSGNVNDQETLYDPGDSVLVAIRDAADSEFPGVANCYVDKTGVFQFHGRYARFQPETVAASASGWNFGTFAGGDGAAISSDSTRAQIREFKFSRPRSRIINSAVSYPRGIDVSDIAGQYSTVASSIGTFGYHSWSATDLIVLEHKTNGNTGNEECQLFAQYYTSNYSVPRVNIETVTFESLGPDDDRAEATWRVLTDMDISDRINLSVADAGISDEEFFVEGISMQVRPLNPDYDHVSLTPNLTPASYYGTATFGTI